MNNFIEDLNWRYATKKFDASKKISDEDFNFIKTAMQLSASSYGLQPYEVLIIENPEIRQLLLPHCWNQSQIVDASHLVIIANKTQFGDELVDQYINNVIATRNIPAESIEGYANFMKKTLSGFSNEDKSIWTAKQCYLVLGNLLNAAAVKRIDTCPMEGFVAEKVNEILKLDSKNLNACVMATLGYRSEEDATQHYAKVRKPFMQLYTTI